MAPLRAAAAAAAALLGANLIALPGGAGPYPPLSELRLVPEDAAVSAALVSLGMRRLAADLAFIRLMVYYGSPERDARERAEAGGLEAPGHDHDEHPAGHHHAHSGGVYRDLGPRALRILALDPYFDYAALYVAGALAFNQQRPAEAVSVLQVARRTEPRNWKYLSYLGAIAFHKKGDPARVLRELDPVLRAPDCPTMLKNMAAFMNVRLGRREEAARLYREIVESRDESYRANAERALRELGLGPRP